MNERERKRDRESELLRGRERGGCRGNAEHREHAAETIETDGHIWLWLPVWQSAKEHGDDGRCVLTGQAASGRQTIPVFLRVSGFPRTGCVLLCIDPHTHTHTRTHTHTHTCQQDQRVEK